MNLENVFTKIFRVHHYQRKDVEMYVRVKR